MSEIRLPNRPLLNGEVIAFSRKSPLGNEEFHHLVAGPQYLVIIDTLVDDDFGYETVIQVSREISIWLINAMTSLLLPFDDGGASSSTFSVERAEGNTKLNISRTASVEAEDDPGFSLYAVPENQSADDIESVTWSDRLLFDGGLFAALRAIALETAAMQRIPTPRLEAATIRPNWMGRTPDETPPPEMAQ